MPPLATTISMNMYTCAHHTHQYKLHISCRMDSFVLAETFKYLYLMFAEEEDILLPIDDFIFTTEAHLIPLNLSTISTNNSYNNDEPSAADDNTCNTEDIEDITTSNEEDAMAMFDEIMIPSVCSRVETDRWTYDYYQRLLLQQCGSLRFGLMLSGSEQRKESSNWKRSLTVSTLDFTNDQHVKELTEMGITVKSMAGGQIQLLQSSKVVS